MSKIRDRRVSCCATLTDQATDICARVQLVNGHLWTNVPRVGLPLGSK